MTTDMIKLVDLFCGAGGLSYGFLQTGCFEVVLAVEKDPAARQTYTMNHDHGEVPMLVDATTVDYLEALKDKGSIDVVVGGPPCQGFSNANRHSAHIVCGNNQLVKEFIRAIEVIQPKAFVMENVPTITSPKHRFLCTEDERERLISDLQISVTEERVRLCTSLSPDEALLSFLRDETDLSQSIIPPNQSVFLHSVVSWLRKADCDQLERHKTRWAYTIKCWHQTKIDIGKSYEDACTVFIAMIEKWLGGDTLDYITAASNLEIVLQVQHALIRMDEIKRYSVDVGEITLNGDGPSTTLDATVWTYRVGDYLDARFNKLGYLTEEGVLNAVNFGAPQCRDRFICIGIRENALRCTNVSLPLPLISEEQQFATVREAIADLKHIATTASTTEEVAVSPPGDDASFLEIFLRNTDSTRNHFSPVSGPTAKLRFAALAPGENFHDLPPAMKGNYANPHRTQNTIYRRLVYDEPCGTVINVRKSMWIHPSIDRILSVREAARLQTFPDSFCFYGARDSQYQQIGNAVPPLLGWAIADHLLGMLGMPSANPLSEALRTEAHEHTEKQLAFAGT